MAKVTGRFKRNQVRIIAGTCRGRKITFHDAATLRPTADMVREKVFSWLGGDLTGLRVLDLFAGSGALGFEAASRGASYVLMLDNDAATAGQLKRLAAEFKLQAVAVKRADALALLKSVSNCFDVIFLDPPYVFEAWENLWDALTLKLAKNAVVYVEQGHAIVPPESFEIYREGRSGKSFFALLRRTNMAES